MLAAIQAYAVGKFIHVVAVIVAFGPTYAYAFMGAVAAKSDPRSIPTIHRIIATIDRYLVNPGMLVILLAGFYTVHEEHLKLSTSWVAIGIAGIVIVGAAQGMLFTPWNRKALEISERDLKAGDTLSEEYNALTKKIAGAGQAVGILILVVVFFMTVKP